MYFNTPPWIKVTATCIHNQQFYNLENLPKQEKSSKRSIVVQKFFRSAKHAKVLQQKPNHSKSNSHAKCETCILKVLRIGNQPIKVQ